MYPNDKAKTKVPNDFKSITLHSESSAIMTKPFALYVSDTSPLT